MAEYRVEVYPNLPWMTGGLEIHTRKRWDAIKLHVERRIYNLCSDRAILDTMRAHEAMHWIKNLKPLRHGFYYKHEICDHTITIMRF